MRKSLPPHPLPFHRKRSAPSSPLLPRIRKDLLLQRLREKRGPDHLQVFDAQRLLRQAISAQHRLHKEAATEVGVLMPILWVGCNQPSVDGTDLPGKPFPEEPYSFTP